MPDPSVDLVKVAKNVGRTSRKSCGDCHFQGGGGDAVKHADMSGSLYWPQRNCDIHMGGYDFQCAECHRTRNHKIAGRSTSVPVAEGSRTCQDCHTENPHYENSLLDHHLNRHCDTVACNTCHSPVYSKCQPTKVWWDWSKAGDKSRKPQKGKYGMADYKWKKGEFRWKESAKPHYEWYGGFMKRVLLGDKVDPEQPINITEPVGSIKDPNSKIYPFKLMEGIQAVDAKHAYLLVPHLFPRDKTDKTAFWKGLDWKTSFEVGMEAAGKPFSGEFQWAKTRMYWGVNHEVMPKEMALSCVQCHRSLTGERTCNRCHQDRREIDFKKIIHKGTDFEYMQRQGRDVGHLIGTTDYIDFKALGYPGDPIIHGGRFKKLPLGYTAEGQRKEVSDSAGETLD